MIANCGWCASDDYIEDHNESDDIALCLGPGHDEPRMFQPKAEAAAKKARENSLGELSDGIAADLGLYDDLPDLLIPGEWADTPTVEYRYAREHPMTFKRLLDRWGHVSEGSTKYSTTAFIGSTLGQLSRATNVTHRPGQGTGLFKRNAKIGYWTLEPVPEQTHDMTWERFARLHDIDPESWLWP